MSSVNFLTSTDLVESSTNTNAIIFNKIKELEKNGKVLVFSYKSTTENWFNSLAYIFYRNGVNYSGASDIKISNTSIEHPADFRTFGLKIFCYITIQNSATYTIKTNFLNGNVKLYINGFSIISSFNSNSKNIYLSKGTYLIYIERYNDSSQAPTSSAINSYKTLNIFINTLNSTVDTPIDNYINTNFTLITNAYNTFDSAVKTFCQPNTNLYNSNNVCSKTLQKLNTLNDTVNNNCFNPNFNKGTDGLLNSNCFKIATNKDSTYNSTLKNTLKNSYQTWANKVVTEKTWNDNLSPLTQYVQNMTPTQTEFPFNSNIKDYCENNLNTEFDAKTQTKNQLCKEMYNRTYTGDQKTLADNSIQQIKNNYCDPNKNIANVTKSNCLNEYKTKSDLSTQIRNYCFPNGSQRIRGGLLDPNCNTIYKLDGLNPTIKTNFIAGYDDYNLTAIKNSIINIDPVPKIVNEYIGNENPTKEKLFGTDNLQYLTEFCKTHIGDKFTADVNNDHLCNRLYSSPTYNTNPNISKSIDEIKTNYCSKIVDGKPRYETDPLCAPLQTTLLNNAIQQRCIKDGNFQYADKWCKDTSDANINNSSVPFSAMRTSRNNNLKTNIDLVEVKEYTDNKFLNDDNYNYAINQYAIITNSNKNINDELLKNTLFDYCENIESNYTTNENSQCKGIYDKYKDENNIKISRIKMRDSLCIDNNNILTDNEDNNTTNIFNCKSTVFDTNNLNKFSPAINSFCAVDDNINIPECQNYYETIEKQVADNLQLNSVNKSEFKNKLNDYENNIELSGFNNLNTCQNEYTNDNDYLHILLLFLIILIIVLTISKSICYFKYKQNILKCNE